MKILLSLPESPFDPTNGAARSMRTIAELMAAAGRHEVRCVATTATERPHETGFFTSGRGVEYGLVHVDESTRKWRTPSNEHLFDMLFLSELAHHKPDLLLCYGGHPTDVERYQRAKQAGVKIVFGLRNYGYQQRGFFDFADGVITSSQFLSDWYRTRFGVESTALPLPIWSEDVVAGDLERQETIRQGPRDQFTFINPTRAKGSLLMETVFRVLHETRPDIPLMIVGESSEPEMLRLMDYADTLAWQRNPKQIYARTRVLLVPSVWEEPAGRVIAEAMLNGIPPIITDRGGMPEVANGGAFILPLDKRVTVDRSTPVGIDVAQPWIDLITQLHDVRVIACRPKASFYEMVEALEPGDRAREAAQMYLPENLTPIYEEFFRRILAGKPVCGIRDSIGGAPSMRKLVKSLAALSNLRNSMNDVSP